MTSDIRMIDYHYQDDEWSSSQSWEGQNNGKSKMRIIITITKEMDAFLKRESIQKGLSISGLLRLWIMEKYNQTKEEENGR